MTESTAVVAYDQALFPTLLDQDPEAVRERFARRYGRAETIDDLFNVLEGNTSKGMVGRKLRIDAVAWAPYESDRGIIPLAVCTAFDLTSGDEVEFATTGESLVQFIRQAEIIKAMPFEVKIVTKKTRQGRDALNFERV
jgi:hypothetical protein